MYFSTKEISDIWNVSETWVSILCKQGRIKGAARKGNRWCIPEDAVKPTDKRKQKSSEPTARFRFIDLFAGIGGFHQAMRYLGGECIMAAEINKECVETYKLNFKTKEKDIRGDVNEIEPSTIEPFDVLCAGFPVNHLAKPEHRKAFKMKKEEISFTK